MAKIIKDKESYDTQISEIKDFLEEIQKEEKGVKDKEMFKKLKLNISILINECIKLREYAETLEADNKHVILTNGMHRFIVLRLLYLNERGKCSNNNLDNLNQKYTIPVQTTKVDTTKTYCKYLIDIFNPASIMGRCFTKTEKYNDYYFLTEIKGWNSKELVTLNEDEYQEYLESVISLGNEYDDNYNPTGRCELKKFNGEKMLLTDEELIEFTRNVIINSKRNNEELFENINKYSSLKKFINNYFSDLFDLERGAILNDSVNKSK